MNTKSRKWLHGFFAAIIGGGAGAVTGAFGATAIAPDKFNLSGEFGNFLKLAALTFIINGFMSAMFYLRQSPLPPEDFDTTTITKT